MNYLLKFDSDVLFDIEKHKKAGNKQLLKKINQLLDELRNHPTTGTGKPEQLKGFEAPTWSRRINSQHRLVYQIFETEILVLVIAVWGHYDDK